MSAADDPNFRATRREILKAGGALTIALWLPQAAVAASSGKGAAATKWAPNAFIRIAADSSVTVISKHMEMGQGIYTGLATLVAEELDADWSQIRVESAPNDAELYRNLFWSDQGTGTSTSLANSYEQMRNAGATARALLITAAAQRWNVPASEISIVSGIVQHKSGKAARFGELVADAAKLPLPAAVKLKHPKAFTLIGKNAARVDAQAKSNGSATFTQDVQLPGMLTAVVAHPPRFGAKLKRFDASKAKAMTGVKAVVAFETPVRSGVAVLATDFWSAKQARDALSIEWDDANAFKRSSSDLLAEYHALAQQPGASAKREGDVDKAFAAAAQTMTATYEFPFLAHAAMEPLNCVVRLGAHDCEIWNGAQLQTADQRAVAEFLGLPPESVKIHTLYAGGSFGRRANALSDYVVESAAIAKAAGVTQPVKLVWTREEDMRAGFYRPMNVHALKAGVDAKGRIIAWRHRIVGQSILAGTSDEPGDPIDPLSVEGAVELPYHIPNLSVELHTTKLPVPVQWWRSVGSTHTAFSTECFLDDIARATKQDPYTMRRAMLKKHPRHLAVLDLVAEKSGWKNARAPNESYGLALHESFGTVVAQVAKVVRSAAGPKLERVVCAVDCGLPVNPNIIAMQMESGIGFGLSAALSGAITFKEGQVEQGNFDDYPVLRITDMPAIEVHIQPSKEKPSGVGEPGTPVIAPAFANALAMLNGEPVRSLPLSTQRPS